MHPYQYAQADPDRVAMVVADTGERMTYGELDEASNRAAQLFRSFGLRPGDKIGVILRNCLDNATVYWGAQRAGLLATMISTHLKPAEAAYIVNDSETKLLIVSGDIGETPQTLAAERARLIPDVAAVFDVGDPVIAGARSWREAFAAMPATPVSDQTAGFYLLYSSGTTGRPKGIVLPFAPGPIEEPVSAESFVAMYGGYDPLIAFNAGPLYHGAPLSSMIGTHRNGGTFVTLRKFDAEQTLKAIQDWKVVHGQFVPTMFVRMLKLPDDVRFGYDLSSLRYLIHAAAPCPVETKRRMIEWLGPIIDEYYGASEAVGGTLITSAEWLERPGSVGRSKTGPVHVCGDDGAELPPNEEGLIYFEVPEARNFAYLNDPEKTAKGRHPVHANWYAVGDIGRIDEEGFIFLTDRKDFMIISGGVNIYPQAVEDALIVHPKVFDAAVIGVPNPDFGEEVKAIVQPRNWDDVGDALAEELIDWCRSRISAVSCPRSIEFVRELPRLQSGKLAKHELRRRFGAVPQPA